MASAGSSKSAQKPNKKLQNTMPQKILSSEIIETYIIIPPDGGWGWLVTVTSFISNFTADGIMYTFDLFRDEIGESIGCPSTKLLLANSLMTGFYFLSGPIISALTNRFGYRIVAILGGLISSITMLTTSYTNNLATVLLVYGVMGGIAFGMMYVPSIVVIGFYFERWRALATSIAVCGSSLAISSYPIIFKNILKHMDWRRKFRVLSVWCMICAFCAILYRPLYPVKVGTANDGRILSAANSSILTNRETGSISRYHNRGYPTAADVHGVSTTMLPGPHRASSMSIFINTTTPTTTKSFVKSKIADTSKSKASIVQLGIVYEDQENEREYSKNKCKRCCIACKKCFCWCYGGRKDRPPIRPLYRDDIFYSGSLIKLPEYTSTHSSTSRFLPDNLIVDYHMSVTRITTLEDIEEENERCLCCPISVKRTLATMLDMTLLKSPSFLLLAFSGFFTTLGLYAPFMFFARKAIEHGFRDDEAYLLLSTLGISNTIGRIACGVFSSLPSINALLCSYVSLTICGLATLASTLSYQQVWQFGCACVIGFTIASIAALRSVIIAEMVGLDRLTNGFGLCLLFQGFSCLMGVPVAGFLKDVTGTYDTPFYFAGSVILFSSLLLMPVEGVMKWEKRKHINSE